MASGLFFDPLTLLRLAPLVSTTFSISSALHQDLFFSTFLPRNDDTSYSSQSNTLLPKWFDRAFRKGVIVVIGINTLTISSALANLLHGNNGHSLVSTAAENLATARKWYLAGLLLTFAHFAFVPLVAFSVRDIVEDRKKGRATEDMARWLRVHRIRGLTVDLPGWACFLGAAITALSV